MTYTHKENRGSLFRADKQSDTDRDYSGTANIEGRLFWISGWIQQSEGKPKFMSLSFKPQNAAPAQPKNSAGGGGSVHRDFDDNIPFSPEMRG